MKLIKRAQTGDQQAFCALVESYQERLFAFVWRTLRNHHETEDICQQAFVRAFESLAKYDPKYAFSTWIYTIAYRLCLNHLRKRRPVTSDPDFGRIAEEDSDTAVQIAQSEEATRLQQLIWETIDTLSPAQRASLTLFYRDGMSCQEIGEVLDMPAVTVKSHLHRGREKLSAKLKDSVGEDWQTLKFSDGA